MTTPVRLQFVILLLDAAILLSVATTTMLALLILAILLTDVNTNPSVAMTATTVPLTDATLPPDVIILPLSAMTIMHALLILVIIP